MAVAKFARVIVTPANRGGTHRPRERVRGDEKIDKYTHSHKSSMVTSKIYLQAYASRPRCRQEATYGFASVGSGVGQLLN